MIQSDKIKTPPAYTIYILIIVLTQKLKSSPHMILVEPFEDVVDVDWGPQTNSSPHMILVKPFEDVVDVDWGPHTPHHI
jgi:hypothetical protein